jgi:uncharacterized protein YdhG (YjbR/CyaY superfamily)
MNDVDKYLKSLPDDVRAVLEKLRETIYSVAPDATEKISYQMPAFFHHGALVGFAAFKNHCSLFVWSGSFLNKYPEVLAKYETTKSAIHFTVEKPLPAVLVKKLVKARLAENEAKAKLKMDKRVKKK